MVTIFYEQCRTHRRILFNNTLIGKFSLGHFADFQRSPTKVKYLQLPLLRFCSDPLSFRLQILLSMCVATICSTSEWIIAGETRFNSSFFNKLSPYRCHIFEFFYFLFYLLSRLFPHFPLVLIVLFLASLFYYNTIFRIPISSLLISTNKDSSLYNFIIL